MEYKDKAKFKVTKIEDLPNRFSGEIIGYSVARMFISSKEVGLIEVARFKRKSFDDDNIETNKILDFVKISDSFIKAERHGRESVRREMQYFTFDLLDSTKVKSDTRKRNNTNLENAPDFVKQKAVRIPLIHFKDQEEGLHDFELIGAREKNKREMRFLFDGRDVRAGIPKNEKWIMPKYREKVKVRIEKYNDNKSAMLQNV